MSCIQSPHESCSKTGGGNNHLGGAYLHFILSPKEMKTSAFFQISRNCCCLRITTSGSPVIASYWPLKVCTSINHTSLTKSTAFCLTFWNTHLHLAFHNTQTTREDIVDQTISKLIFFHEYSYCNQMIDNWMFWSKPYLTKCSFVMMFNPWVKFLLHNTI